MKNWIPFAEGEYLVERAWLVAEDYHALCLEEVIVEIYSDSQGRRYLKGRARVRNVLLVELLNGSDNLDLLLDFGEEFKYLLKAPSLQGGKVFSPGVKSVLQFTPQNPWQQIPEDEFKDLASRLRILSDPQTP
jgi:hypothetical protein